MTMKRRLSTAEIEKINELRNALMELLIHNNAVIRKLLQAEIPNYVDDEEWKTWISEQHRRKSQS